MKLDKNKILIAVIVLALIGVGISGYSWLHNSNMASGEFCSIGGTFNCDVVNKGPYSKIFGVPVALVGVIGYAFMALASYMKIRNPSDRQLTLFLGLAAAGGLGFSLYLTGIEAFVLHVWCLLCLTSQAVMLSIFVLVAYFWYNERQGHGEDVQEVVNET
jgi:uncharacterized membrane protein